MNDNAHYRRGYAMTARRTRTFAGGAALACVLAGGGLVGAAAASTSASTPASAPMHVGATAGPVIQPYPAPSISTPPPTVPPPATTPPPVIVTSPPAPPAPRCHGIREHDCHLAFTGSDEIIAASIIGGGLLFVGLGLLGAGLLVGRRTPIVNVGDTVTYNETVIEDDEIL